MGKYSNKTDEELIELQKSTKGSGSPAEKLISDEILSRKNNNAWSIEENTAKTSQPKTPSYYGKTLDEMTEEELNTVGKESGTPGVRFIKDKREGVSYTQDVPKTDSASNQTSANGESILDVYERLLKENNANKPTWDFASESKDVTKAYEALKNVPEFKYDLNADALYQQYKQQYMNQGRLAMQDTIGKAVAMTGGYGNSYAETVGNQAYQGYLTELNDVVPQLYSIAYDKYNTDVKNAQNAYNVARQNYSDRYGEYQDRNNAWQKENADITNQYINAYNLVNGNGSAKEDEKANYKYSDYSSIESKAETMAGNPDALYEYLTSMVESGFISQSVMDALYVRYRDVEEPKYPIKNPSDKARSNGWTNL